MKPNDLSHPLPDHGVWPAEHPAQGPWPPAALAMQFLAKVLAAPATEGSQAWRLDVAGRCIAARLAPSCALQPDEGDRVLCVQALAADDEGDQSGDEEGVRAYILAVLERAPAISASAALPALSEIGPTAVGAASDAAAGGRPATWSLAPGVSLKAGAGQLRIEAQANLALAAPRLHAEAAQASVQAGELNLVYRTLHSVGELARHTVRQMRLVGGLLASVFEQEQHHAGQHTRTVAGVDRLEAELIDHQAGTLLHLQGQQVLANGERVVKMQGAQIHLG